MVRIVPEPLLDILSLTILVRQENEQLTAMIDELEKETDQVQTQLMNEIDKLKSLKRQITLKTPRGMRDFTPHQMVVRQIVYDKITSVFKSHGAEMIDTPIVELKDILTDKYGEDSKLIYDLQNQGGEDLSLRYDLTVPFARYLIKNKITQLKRYHIAKVYRRETPSTAKGIFREFYQCDFDIAGDYDLMLPDVECIKIIQQVLDALDVGSYVIKINHRSILDGIFAVCGVPPEKFNSICSSVDKLDKSSWEDVQKEMIEEKELSMDVADKIGEYVQLNGKMDLVNILLEDERLSANASAVKGLEAIKLLLNYCDLFKLSTKVTFDLSLARCLDYYTGIMFEAALTVHESSDGRVSLGSLAGGGRYDDLVGKMDPKHRKVPCVGVSFGLERIFALIDKSTTEKLRTTETQVYVASVHWNFLEERMKLCNELWEAGFKVEYSYKQNPQLLPQLQYCEEHGIPFAIIMDENEITKDVMKLRNISTKEETEIPKNELIKELRKRILFYSAV